MLNISKIRSEIDKVFNGKTFRKCSKCRKYKILSQYSEAKWCSKGRRKTCKSCENKRREVSRKKYIEKNPNYKISNTLRYKYGITIETYKELVRSQNNKCAICNKKESTKKSTLSVDHCHKTGKVRGLLCHKCNAGIGFLRENVDILRSAIKYVRRFS